MKKTMVRLMGVLALVTLVLLAFAAPAIAQAEPTVVNVFGVQIEVTTVDALVALLAGGIVTLVTQFVKKKIKFAAEGPGAFALTVVTCYATTGFYFLVLNPMSPWDWLKYIIYGAAVLGESTGFFHLYKKATNTPTTS